MLEYALRELSRRKRRTAAAAAGYAAAAAVITLILTMLYNGEQAANSVLSGTGTHFTAYIPACTADSCHDILLDKENEGFYVGSTRVRLMDETAVTLIRSLYSVGDASPFIIFRLSNAGRPVRDFTIAGVPQGDSKAVRTNSCSAQDLISGRFELKEGGSSVVLEEQFARTWNLEVGSSLDIGGKVFTVEGVVNTGIRLAKADAYLPLGTAKTIINGRLTDPLQNECGMFLVESANADAHETAIAEVKTVLGPSAGVSSYNCYKPAAQVMGINASSALAITIVVSICLFAFSLQSRYASVGERRYEIGILGAMGWRRGFILRQILLESLALAFGGWLIGSLVALLLILALPAAILGRSVFPLVFALNLAIAVCGGTLAGIPPGLSAASRSPAECLRRL